MSRHRNIRKVSIGDDDYDDEIAQSYDDKYAISPGTSAMYMYNRGNDSQSISQFMNTQIPEEDDPDDKESQSSNACAANRNVSSNSLDTTSQNSNLKSKIDEDFMFQMDKEPNFNRPVNSDKKDDGYIKKLLLEDDKDSKSLSLSDLAGRLSANLATTDNNDSNNDNGIFDCDLNSLAEKYSNSQQQHQQPLSLTFLGKNENELSSSIDRLLDSFFSKNFENTNSSTVPTPSNPIVIDFSLDEIIKSDSNVLNKSKSISIVNNKSEATISSLSDLATEYLAHNITPSATTNFSSNTPFEENVVDLIDYEFSSRFSLTEESNLVDFNPKSLVIRHDKKLNHLSDTRLSSSCGSALSNLISMNANNLSSHSLKSYDQLNEKNKRSLANLSHIDKLENFEFITPTKRIESVKQMFKTAYLIKSHSKFGDVFCFDSSHSIIKNSISFLDDSMDEKFDYSNQIDYFKKQDQLKQAKRKRFVIDASKRDYINKKASTRLALDKLQNSKLKKSVTNENTTTLVTAAAAENKESLNPNDSPPKKLTILNNSNHKSKQASKTAKLKPKANANKANISHKEKPIQIFDFSIPSPDDIVIAKQKFAFKNARFKP